MSLGIRRRLASWELVLAAILLWPTSVASAQSRWPVPPETVAIDLSASGKQVHVVFDGDGLAYEAAVDFLLIGSTKVVLDITLPEPGRLDVRSTLPESQCEVHNVSVTANKGRAEIVSLVPSMSRTQARQLAEQRVDEIIAQVEQPFHEGAKGISAPQLAAFLRERGVTLPKENDPMQRNALIAAYARVKAAPAVLEELRKQCAALADAHPAWVGAETRAGWKKAERTALTTTLRKLVQMQLMADYLTRHGIPYQDSENLIEETAPLVDAVARITSGAIGSNAAQWREVRGRLGPAGIESVRRAVSVQLSIRLIPPVDVQDANSQWYLGQRVACRARDVSVIRVEGTLDPANNDAADWWILERYDAGEVNFRPARGNGFQIDRLFQTPQGTLLRVRATGSAAANYWFELRPVNQRGRLQVTIHESPNDDRSEFPY